MKAISYKGFQASVEFEDEALFVRVLHIDDLLVAQVEKASDVQGALIELVNGYLEDCKAIGKEPMKQFSGTFNVRVGPDIHREAAMTAAEQGMNLNAWVLEAVREKLECSELSQRVERVISKGSEDIHLLAMARQTIVTEDDGSEVTVTEQFVQRLVGEHKRWAH